MTHSFTEEAFSGHITGISFGSPSLPVSATCSVLDGPSSAAGDGPTVFKVIFQFLEDNVWLRVGHVLLIREPQGSLWFARQGSTSGYEEEANRHTCMRLTVIL